MTYLTYAEVFRLPCISTTRAAPSFRMRLARGDDGVRVEKRIFRIAAGDSQHLPRCAAGAGEERREGPQRLLPRRPEGLAPLTDWVDRTAVLARAHRGVKGVLKDIDQ